MHRKIWHVMNIPSEKKLMIYRDIILYIYLSYEIIIISVPVLGFFQPEKKTSRPSVESAHTARG